MKSDLLKAVLVFSLGLACAGLHADDAPKPDENSPADDLAEEFKKPKPTKGWVDLTDQGADEDTAAPPSPAGDDDFTPPPPDSPAP